VKELFSLLLLVSESKSSVVTSPEILDAAALERWLSGSVWGLLALNLLALALFVLSISSPQITKIKTFILTWQAEREKIRSEMLAQKQAEQAAAAAAIPATSQESSAEPTASEAAPTANPGSNPPAPPSAETADTPEAKPEIQTAEAIAEEIPPPPPPPDTISTSPVEPLATPSEVEEKTEVLAEETTTIASQEQSVEPTNDEPPVPPQSLPETNLSGEKKEAGDAMTFESKQDFEKALNDFLSSPTEQTEEIPIFDTSSLDESLRWTATEKPNDKDKSKEGLS